MAIQPLNYRGPSLEYKGYLDNVNARPEPGSAGTGYADFDFLVAELENLAINSKSLYEECQNKLVNYTLNLDTSNVELINSHKMSYPDDETPDSISFKEYIYNYSTSLATSAQYVNRYYENKIRGVHGTNALDLAHIARITYSEVKRIQDFLEKYIGDIDDPTEFRVLETLQDWTQNAKALLTKFRQAFAPETFIQIPNQEMAELTEDRAKEFQGLFQSKLNIINASISDLISQLYKDWDLVADIFYNKMLGPSLSFNIKIGRNITNIDSNKAPTLYKEAALTTAGLKAQFDTALNDQVKRNNLFFEYCQSLYQNIRQRDAYVNYIDQLGNLGTTISNPFIQQSRTEADVIDKNTSLLGEKTALKYTENSSSGHNFLTGRDDPTAHPQYLLKDGDILTGRLEIFGQLQLNGQDLTPIFSMGQDGNALVRSASIDWTNADPNTLAQAVNEFAPNNLQLSEARVLSDGKIEYIINFEIENSNVQGYEFEVIEL